MKKIKYYRNFKRLISIFFTLTIVVGALSSLLYFIERKNIREEAMITSSKDIDLFSRSLIEKISFINTDVFVLKDIIELQDVLSLNNEYTEFNSTEDRILIENEFLSLLDRKNIYDQARILDNTGQEILRVNYNQGEPEIADIDSLQNKADRYYFTDSIILDENEMYISKLDLNEENGEIEITDSGNNKPMIRFAVPLFDSEGNKLGVMILNYLADDVLNSLYNFESSSYSNIEMLNENGYFLFSSFPERLWGFMYDGKEDETYSKYHEFDIFENCSETIQQYYFNGLNYTLVRVTAEKLSDQSSLLLHSDITVVLGVTDFIIISSTEVSKINDIISLNKLVIYSLLIVSVFVLLISRLVDELFYSGEEKLKNAKYAATHDVLTNIPNRFYIHNMISYKMTRQHEFSILYMDFDGFKKINDEFGHSIGDEALKAGVIRIKDSVRHDDIVSRIGGDEFLVVLNNLIDRDIIARICENMIDNFKEKFILNGNICKMGLSIGVSIHPKDSMISDELIDNADKAMYEVKNKGKNNYKFFEDIEVPKK